MPDASPRVSLLPFSADRDLPVLERWLHQPHVSRWWGDPDKALAEVSERPREGGEALIAADDVAVGYVRWDVPSREELDAAGLSEVPSDVTDIDIFIGAPDAVGAGVGSEALRQLLKRLLAVGSGDIIIAPSVDNTRAVRAYEKAGFVRRRRFIDPEDGECWLMVFEPSPAEGQSSGGSQMEIVEASESDLEDVLLVERLAFGGEEEAGLVRDLLGDPSARPLLSLLARQDGRAVGHVLFTAAELGGASADIAISILAPLAVIPERQRTGVGGLLIERGIERLAEQGVGLVFVLGHPSYYPRHGFEPAIPIGLLAPYPICPEEAWMVRALRPGLLGEVRGSVVCAATMDRPEYWRE